ncbi:proline-rich domain-containing protein [Winogradskyella sp. Asnod2-B02-A]|uniref:proline-rich domain-containing protein n=1 Tax=Winogradskyella sp. Asnod2-B02-A TaxID=3160583 RepID=UPI00386CF7C2
MKKNTILYILVAFLIVVNGFFLFNYMSKSNDNAIKGPQDNKDFIVKELGFNKTQLAEFKQRSEGHFKTMMSLSDDIKELKDNLFGTLSNEAVNETAIDSISALICEKETKKEKEIYYHFRMIREIANDKQKEKFESILLDALRQGDQGNRPPPPNGEEGHRPPPRGGSEGQRPPPRSE